jgi:ornithine lipid hydroxylase
MVAIQRMTQWSVRYLGMPVLLVGSAALALALLGRGVHEGIVLVGIGTALFVLVWGLEYVAPYRRDWNGSDGQRLNDIGHTLVGTYLGGGLGNVLTFSLVGVIAAAIAGSTGSGIWPGHWPLWLQVAIVFLLADLGRYIQHRLMHEVPLFWRFHLLHHSTEVLTVFKTSRNHLVERLFQQTFLLGPVLLLGAGAEAIIPFVVINSFLGIFAHSNVDFRIGAFECVFMGPAAHRLHHSRALDEGTTNYGTSLLVWDWLFRTYTNPLRRAREVGRRVDVGVEGDPTPGGFWAQLIAPITMPAVAASEADAAAPGSDVGGERARV